MIPKALTEAERVLSKLRFLNIMEPVPSGGYFNTAQPVIDKTDICCCLRQNSGFGWKFLYSGQGGVCIDTKNVLRFFRLFEQADGAQSIAG